ncbi:NATT3 protein, partial [Pycnonotus jocosus]|nr:NATT3 protein [Pycnonotus jocosus]
FPCSTPSCDLGSFSPGRGRFCSYTWGEEERRSPEFRLLVNPGGFEALLWVPGSFGSAPEGAVESCPNTDLFVGRSPQGLGKVSKEHQALFVPVQGEEVWYKWYEVLVVRRGSSDLSISSVSYNGSAASLRSEPAAL